MATLRTLIQSPSIYQFSECGTTRRNRFCNYLFVAQFVLRATFCRDRHNALTGGWWTTNVHHTLRLRMVKCNIVHLSTAPNQLAWIVRLRPKSKHSILHRKPRKTLHKNAPFSEYIVFEANYYDWRYFPFNKTTWQRKMTRGSCWKTITILRTMITISNRVGDTSEFNLTIAANWNHLCLMNNKTRRGQNTTTPGVDVWGIFAAWVWVFIRWWRFFVLLIWVMHELLNK